MVPTTQLFMTARPLALAWAQTAANSACGPDLRVAHTRLVDVRDVRGMTAREQSSHCDGVQETAEFLP